MGPQGIAQDSAPTAKKATPTTADVYNKIGTSGTSGSWMAVATRLIPVTLHHATMGVRVQQQFCKAAVDLHNLTLARQTNDVRIIEKVKQEVLNIIQRFWPAQVEQEDSNFVSCASWFLNLQVRQTGINISGEGSRVSHKLRSCKSLLLAEPDERCRRGAAAPVLTSAQSSQ